MSIATGLRQAAASALGALGTTVMITRRVTGTYDTTTHAPANTEVDFTVTGVWASYATREVDGEQVLQGDRKLLIAASALTFEPTPEDYVIDASGRRYRIVTVRSPQAQDQSALHVLQLRGEP